MATSKVILANQTDAAFLAVEAREHAEALEAILAFGRTAQTLWAAGCSVAETQILMNGEARVN